jgi:hypothetical protein
MHPFADALAGISMSAQLDKATATILGISLS